MRIFVAGATGVIGRAMLPLLLEAGHDVAGLTRTPSNVEFLRSAGALPYVCDVYDRVTLIDAVRQFRPEVVVHQLTDLPDDVAEVQTKSDDNARMRVVGTKNLIEAAQLASARKLLAQSIAFEPPPGRGAEAVDELENSVLAASGVVLRYGRLYGRGTFYPLHAPDHPRVHVDTAALQTVEAIDAPDGSVIVIKDPEDTA